MSERSGYETLVVRRVGDGGKVAIVSLNRPKVYNAVNMQMLLDFATCMRDVDGDNSIHVIIFSGGASKHFCSGADLEELKTDGITFANMLSTFHCITNVRKPVIAAVTGVALGGGCEIALMCDIVYCGSSSRFALPEVTHGTIPGCGGTQRLTAAVGKSRAMEMILSGDRITAQEAVMWGLASRVFPDDEVLDQAISLAHRIAAHSPVIVGMAKKSIKAFVDHSLSGMQVERDMFQATLETEARREGVAAYEKKKNRANGNL